MKVLSIGLFFLQWELYLQSLLASLKLGEVKDFDLKKIVQVFNLVEGLREGAFG